MTRIIMISVILILATFAICGGEFYSNMHLVSASSTIVIYPMNDTTASTGLSMYSSRPIIAEYVTNSSYLAGKAIDTIKVDLKKSVGASGPVQVGIFNSDKSIKMLFGTIDASTLSKSYNQYSFSLPYPQNYKVQSGDRIGLKFTGGDYRKYVSVMIDQNNSFDKTNSYLDYFQNSWQSVTNQDMWMVLTLQTIADLSVSASPSGGTYTSPQSVTLSASAPSTIFYTTDGSTPTTSSASGPSPLSGIMISTNSTLQYFAKDGLGNTSPVYTQTFVILIAQDPGIDKFGIKKIYPDMSGGMQWFSDFDIPRNNTGTIDTIDPWLDFSHGDGAYVISNGTLSASPKYSAAPVRIYIHNPDLQSEWHNVEITTYGRNDKMDTSITDWNWSGLMAYGRTNHGTNGDETVNLCDDRGYGGRLLLNGKFDFEKETAHHLANGYDQKASVPVWSPSTMPLNQWIGYKFIIYDKTINGVNGVQLEEWLDKYDNGNWAKISSYFDNGTNFGHTGNYTACATGVNPQLQLTHSVAMLNSETGKPHLTVYWRTDGQWMSYKDMSIREIISP